MINNPTVQELMARSPLPVGERYAMSFGFLLVIVMCGVAMLQGRNWARLLYTISSGLSILVSLATTPFSRYAAGSNEPAELS